MVSFRADVVNGELETPPQIEIVGVAERLHFGRVRRARREAKQTGALAVAERTVERDGPGLAPQLELHGLRSEMLVVGGEALNFLGRQALTTAPVPAPVPAVVALSGPDLQ